MRVRALSSTGDWTFGSGLNNYLTSENAVKQAIATRLQMFLGDCFFATNQGIDWFTFLGGSKSQIALQLALNAVILNTQSLGQNVISSIQTVGVSLNDVTRVFSITYNATSIFGPVSSAVNINLGIGMVPPVNNLLPQFDQTLLNNVGATVINNAIFQSAIFWEVDLAYYIERRSTSYGFIQRGTLRCMFDTNAGTWIVEDNIWGGASGPISGVTFSINASTGQVYYASDNMAGTGYVGNLIMQATNSFKAGS